MVKTNTKSKKLMEKRTRLEWALLLTLLAIIIYLLLAVIGSWWPFNESEYGSEDLGTAFYTASMPKSLAGTGDTSGDVNNGGSNNNGTNGTNGSNGSDGSDGSDGNNGGGTTNPPSSNSSSDLLNFAATLNTGNSKETISVRARNLNERCSVLVNTTTAGKQEVCVYTEGDKIITVTYLNDRVISASRSGF